MTRTKAKDELATHLQEHKLENEDLKKTVKTLTHELERVTYQAILHFTVYTDDSCVQMITIKQSKAATIAAHGLVDQAKHETKEQRLIVTQREQ
jgi:hypothetical protein